ncbi:hypothetical protein [Variovorax guangxiensis]|uniref:Uncharacterized protein n=1 Tax=Variovorax guangxiensis TaxID=1775474 RepID=A0A840FLL0_9BURK|nr:hypothetical protein [Variovorax guangxiensis]MBB4220047.1 hypothetical protein [Variovorax guangxiensis]
MTSKQQQPEEKEEKEGKSPGKFHFPTSGNPEQGKVEKARPTEQPASEEALDSGVEESFPASDPVSVTVTKVKLPSSEKKKDVEEKAKAGKG